MIPEERANDVCNKWESRSDTSRLDTLIIAAIRDAEREAYENCPCTNGSTIEGKKVYVVYSDMGHDGYSIPFKVFSSEEGAEEYCNTKDPEAQAQRSDDIYYYEELEIKNT